jgi:hypothetical protein
MITEQVQLLSRFSWDDILKAIPELKKLLISPEGD